MEDASPIEAVLRRYELSPGPEEVNISKELQEEIWHALEQLTPQQRAAIVLRYYLEWSEKKLAGELLQPVRTIKWLLFTDRRAGTRGHPVGGSCSRASCSYFIIRFSCLWELSQLCL